MNEPPADFDLKFMPDWLKESAAKNPYADYEVREPRERGERPPRGRGGSGRPGGREGRGQERGRGDKPGERPPRRDGCEGERRPGGGRGERPPHGRGGPARHDKKGGQEGAQRSPERQSQPPREEAQPAPVKIEFLPDPNCVASIAKQIRATNRAYSLFDLARMFLARPERHRVRITAEQPDAKLYQAGENGPVGLDRQSVERAAFGALTSQFYVEESIQRDPPKGNFTNIARHRFTGTLLGPTNHHGYQLAMRKLYEERFSRRMSFPDFQREIEVVTEPALIEQWKEQTRTKTIYKLRPPEAVEAAEPAAKPSEEAVAAETPQAETPAEPQQSESAPQPQEQAAAAIAEEPPPVTPEQPAQPTFESLSEVEQHFREHHLGSVMRSGRTFEIHGETSRALPDRRIAAAVRQAWEKERGFPGQMMHYLRTQFSQANLHVFKHRKRMQFVTAVRPAPFSSGDRAGLTGSVAEILNIIESTRDCTRATLASAVLGQVKEDEAELAKRKAALATDLRWLIDAGRVIEFGDGRIELPFVPKLESRPAAETKGNAATSAPPDAKPTAETSGAAPTEEVEAAAAPEPIAAVAPEPDAATPSAEPPAISAEQSSAQS